MKFILRIVCIGVLCMAWDGPAGQVVWTGDAGPDGSGAYLWSNANNWKEGAVPGIGDVPVFAVDGSVTINSSIASGTYHRLGGMRFTKGTVVFTSDKYFYFEQTTNEIFVAAGANACFSNVVDGWGNDDTKTILKTGRGLLTCQKIGEGKRFASVVVKEGMLKSLPGASLPVRGSVEVAGGEVSLSGSGLNVSSGGGSVVVSGGIVGGSLAHPASRAGAALIPSDVPLLGDAAVTVSGGDVHLYGNAGVGNGHLEVTGGRIHTRSTISPVSGATAGNPNVVRLDGGELVAKLDAAGTYTYYPFSSSSALRTEVGPMGAILSQEAAYGFLSGVSIVVEQAIVAASGAQDGGVSQFGYVPWAYKKPFGIAGTFAAEGGESVVNASADLATTPRFFGSGAMSLTNHRVTVASRSEAATLALPGAGKALSIAGGSALALRTDSSKAAVSAEIEGLSFSDGGVLYLRDAGGNIGGDGKAKVTVAGGVQTNSSNGRVLLPVLGTSNGAADTYFLTYDPVGGFKRMELSTASSLSCTDPTKVVEVSNSWTSVPANAKRAVDALRLLKGTSVEFYAGAELTVGDGTNPAMILLCGAYLAGTPTSAIRFGTSRGVICAQGCLSDSPGEITANRIKIPIVSANGVDYVSYPQNEGTARQWHFIQVTGTNTYSGATHVGAVTILAQNVHCFSSGKVYVTGGEAYGGQVRFDVADGTWANDFCVSGWGVRNTEYSGHHYNGALSFSKNATLTGSVELGRLARLCAKEGATGTLTGVVSGGRLQVYDSPGVVRLTASNTYSGGTEIVDGTLEVAADGAVGRGAILLDGGTLRFVNTSPITFENAVEPGSVGRVEICGAEVKFTHPSWLDVIPYPCLARGTHFSYPSLEESEWHPYRKGVLLIVR